MADMLVIIDYDEVVEDPSDNHSLHEKLEKAFGAVGSIGLIAIRNVPDFVATKESLFPLAHTLLVNLPPSYITSEREDPTSLYNAGYSFGREKLGNQPDKSKASSFYFNPLTDAPGSEEDQIRYPYSYPRNKWPTSKLPEVEPAAKKLGSIMKDVVVELAKHIDAFAKAKVPSYQEGQLCRAMINRKSQGAVAVLLSSGLLS